MYSYEERLKAVQLYIQYDKSYASVFRELGYPPSSHSIKLWYKEYEETGGLHKSYSSHSKYSDEQRKAAVQYYIEHGRSKSRTVKALGYPTRQQLTEWLKQDLLMRFTLALKDNRWYLYRKNRRNRLLSSYVPEMEARRKSLINIMSAGTPYIIGPGTFSGKEMYPPCPGKSLIPLLSLKTQWILLNRKSKTSIMKRKTSSVRFTVCSWKKMSLKKAAEILKKDEGVSLEKLTNREKAVVIGALRSKYKLHELLDVFHMAKSSYCYQQAVLNAPDKYADLRLKIRTVFDESSGRYGYRRIHSSLKNDEFTVSEKVIRKLMQEEKLIVPNVKPKKYNSYKGEITPAVPNVIERNFHAEQPNMEMAH